MRYRRVVAGEEGVGVYFTPARSTGDWTLVHYYLEDAGNKVIRQHICVMSLRCMILIHCIGKREIRRICCPVHVLNASAATRSILATNADWRVNILAKAIMREKHGNVPLVIPSLHTPSLRSAP